MAAVASVSFNFKDMNGNTVAGQTVPVDANGALPTFVADGGHVTLGTKADLAPANPTTAGSVIGKLSGIWAALLGLLTVDTVVKSAAANRGGQSTVKAASAAVTAGGTGYVVGDTVTNAAGVFTVATVNSGAVATVTATTPTALAALTSGALAQSATSGAGTGATLTPSYAAAAVQIAAVNTARRGFSIQNQSQAPLWFSSVANATADFNSFALNPGDTFESSPQHVGTGAISVIGTGAGQSFYAREF